MMVEEKSTKQTINTFENSFRLPQHFKWSKMTGDNRFEVNIQKKCAQHKIKFRV